MGDNGWINCSSDSSRDTRYRETLTDKSDEIFVNICSKTGVKHIREISAFVKPGRYYDPVEDKFGRSSFDVVKYGCRVNERDYENIIQDTYEGKHFISWVDLTKASGRGKTRIQQLINCGSLDGIIKDGPAILSHKPLETLVREINEIVKPGNARKARAGAEGRWNKNSITNPSSGSSK